MSVNNKLTIILTLKGRFNYTRRWLEWAVSQNCPFKVLIADGGLDDSVRLHLASLRTNNLNLEYVRYPPDLTLKDWFVKISDITQRVETKYTILTDNDDFLIYERLGHAIEKMERNGEISLYTRPQYRIGFNYAGFHGRHMDLDMLVKPNNDIYVEEHLVTNRDRYMDKSLIARLEYAINNFNAASFWYGIHLTTEMQKTHATILKGSVSLAIIQEWYLIYRAIIKNSIFYDEISLPYLVRQEQTSEAASSLYDTEAPHRIFLNRTWSDDFYFLIKALYDDAVDEGIAMSFADFEFFIKKNYENYFLRWNRFAYWSRKNNKYLMGAKYIYNRINYWRKHKSIARYAGDPELVKLRHFLLNYRP